MNKKSLFALLFVLVSAGFVFATPDQPRMMAARADLQKAKAELIVAEHNKGGHRVKAISLINQAMAAVNRGIAFDRRHNHATITAPRTFDQPHMERALEHLRSARNNLENATADKGGYRARAINLVDAAIEEVKLGIAAGS